MRIDGNKLEEEAVEFRKLFIKAKEQYLDEFDIMPQSGLPRNYFREFLVDNGGLQECDYMKIWDGFTSFKREMSGLLDRGNINIVKDHTKHSKGKVYIVSSIIEGSPVNETFFKSLKTYAKSKGATIELLTMRGVNVADFYGRDMYEKYGSYFTTESKYNNNLIAQDFILNPQMVKSLTGLSRYSKKEYSMIVASPKQFLETVPTSKGGKPHTMWTTGTVCEPNYRPTRQGQLASLDNQLGALIVEVVDEDLFFIRNILFDGVKGFYDLDTYYSADGKSKKVRADALVVGDIHIGVEDEIAVNATKEQIQRLNPKKVIFHDTCDFASINPHQERDALTKVRLLEHQKTLEKELDYTHAFLDKFIKDMGIRDYYAVASNHDYFLDRYLAKGTFIEDTENAVLSCKLFVGASENYNPVEYYFNYIKKKPIKRLKFLKLDEHLNVGGIRLDAHGHKGSNGAKGSPASLELSYGDCTVGHSHKPSIFRGVFSVGCVCKLHQPYNAGGGSSWLHANVVQFKGGIRQMIITIDGEWHV